MSGDLIPSQLALLRMEIGLIALSPEMVVVMRCYQAEEGQGLLFTECGMES